MSKKADAAMQTPPFERPPLMRRYRLSKSKLQSHAQCSKRLWLELNNPLAATKDEMAELIFARGTAFGEAAHQCFPGGMRMKKASDEDTILHTQATLEAFRSGRPRVPLFEAAFAHRDVVVYADVLEPCPDGSWCLVEIKSGVLKEDEAPKEHYVRDAATQAWILLRQGLSVSRVELGQARKDFVLRAEKNYEGILHRVDVTAQALALTEEIERSVDAALTTIDGPCPEVVIGSQCSAPNKCPFVQHCCGSSLKEGENIRIPVWHLAGEPTSKLVASLMSEGFRDLAQVPEERLSRPMHRIMHGIARGKTPYVDAQLREHLLAQPFPRYFLDYETNNAPLPLWFGTRPGESVPFQFSVHKWTSLNGPVVHTPYLCETRDDPRPALARELAKAMEEPGPVYAWNGNSTEGPITLALARAFPEHEDVLTRVAQSCKDMDPVRQFREWFYHPAMKGGWGLKAISRALFAKSPYEGLEIANGVDAMREYEKFLGMAAGPEREKVRQALLEYCNTDTQVMLDIWRALTHSTSEGVFPWPSQSSN